MDKLKILIIDDSKADRNFYRHLFNQNHGFHAIVEEADNAKDGMKLWKENSYDCILLDNKLPDLDGVEIATIMRKEKIKYVPIIMLTSQGNESIAVKAMKAGIDDYLVKDDINSSALKNAIINVINKIKMELQLIYNQKLEQQKQLTEEELKLKTNFLHNMSHELRSPLNPIKGFAKLVVNEILGPLNEKQKSALNSILKNADILLNLINKTLKISEIDAGTLTFSPVQFNLKQCIDEIIESYKPELIQKNIIITCNIETDSATVFLDNEYFKQIVDIYLSNAIKFSQENSSITINTRAENPKKFKLEIIDNGIGIESNEIEKLFYTPFHQVDSSITKAYQGTGLSLYFAKRLVEAQGGEIGLTSILGQGSIFYAILPKKYVKEFVHEHQKETV